MLLLATKADTVPPNQRAALRSLLMEMCERRVAGAARIAPPATGYVAAIRTTEEVEREMEGGERVRVVQGLCSEQGKVRRVTMIDIPETMPSPAYFRRRAGHRAPRFVPPKIEGGGRYGIPNLRLGQSLNDLLGDLLR